LILFSGVVLFPILIPWIPTFNFSTKGLSLGIMATSLYHRIALGNGRNGTLAASRFSIELSLYHAIPTRLSGLVTGLTLMIILSVFAMVGKNDLQFISDQHTGI